MHLFRGPIEVCANGDYNFNVNTLLQGSIDQGEVEFIIQRFDYTLVVFLRYNVVETLYNKFNFSLVDSPNK